MKFYSARQAIHDAYAVYLTGKSTGINPRDFLEESQLKKPDNNQQVCNAVEAGMVIATVENLEEPYSSWAKWAYGPRTEHALAEQSRFFQWLEQDVMTRLDGLEKNIRQATGDKVRDLVAYTVLDYRSYSVNERHLYPVNLIIKRCKIHRQNWKRDFLSWHQYYWTFCDEHLDRAALIPVSETIKRLKYGKEQIEENE